jgi:hypothetical protein
LDAELIAVRVSHPIHPFTSFPYRFPVPNSSRGALGRFM